MLAIFVSVKVIPIISLQDFSVCITLFIIKFHECSFKTEVCTFKNVWLPILLIICVTWEPRNSWQLESNEQQGPDKQNKYHIKFQENDTGSMNPINIMDQDTGFYQNVSPCCGEISIFVRHIQYNVNAKVW